jgi:hypothetical protein
LENKIIELHQDIDFYKKFQLECRILEDRMICINIEKDKHEKQIEDMNIKIKEMVNENINLENKFKLARADIDKSRMINVENTKLKLNFEESNKKLLAITKDYENIKLNFDKFQKENNIKNIDYENIKLKLKDLEIYSKNIDVKLYEQTDKYNKYKDSINNTLIDKNKKIEMFEKNILEKNNELEIIRKRIKELEYERNQLKISNNDLYIKNKILEKQTENKI